jgi:hypothetical protein
MSLTGKNDETRSELNLRPGFKVGAAPGKVWLAKQSPVQRGLIEGMGFSPTFGKEKMLTGDSGNA